MDAVAARASGAVIIHSFTFTLCNRGRPFGPSGARADAVPALLLESVGVAGALSV